MAFCKKKHPEKKIMKNVALKTHTCTLQTHVLYTAPVPVIRINWR